MLTTDGDVDPTGLRVAQQLLDEGICAAVDYRCETASTNTLALAELRDQGVDQREMPKLYLADSQTAGRGRHGRRWVANDGTLTFSLTLDRSAADQRAVKLCSLAVGVGVARGIEFEFAPLQAKLKWPNDVQISGGKVAGILLETTPNASGRVVIGIGINVGPSPDLSLDPTAGSVRSIAEVIGRRVHRYELLVPILGNVVAAIADLDRGADELLEEFRGRCLLTGHRVQFQQGVGTCQGDCQGVSDDGDLVVETDSGICRLQSGEAGLVRKTETPRGTG